MDHEAPSEVNWAELPGELVETVVGHMASAAVLALACVSQASSRYLAHERWSARRAAKEAVAVALLFIRLEHRYDWVVVEEEEEGAEVVTEDEDEEVLWRAGPHTQGCDSLAALYDCTSLNLSGREKATGRGYQVDPRGCNKRTTIGGLGITARHGSDFDGLFTLPSALCSALPSLTELDVSNNKLAELPADFASLPSLKKLNLSCNSFVTVPPALSALLTLECLEMRWCFQLRDATGLSHLLRLRELRVDPRHSDPVRLPAFHRLTSLTRLCMHGKRSGLPPSFEMPASLLDLSFNVGDHGGSNDCPPAAMLATCASLTSLSLGGTFAHLPRQYALLPTLSSLHLANVGLCHLPPNLGELRSLRHLNVRRNHLSGLPTSIVQLRSLRTCLADSQSHHSFGPMGEGTAADHHLPNERRLMAARLARDAARLPSITALDIGAHVPCTLHPVPCTPQLPTCHP